MNKEKTEEQFDREAYRTQLQNNQMIGWLLGFAGIALAVILYVLAQALR